jgi:hypothetical protein
VTGPAFGPAFDPSRVSASPVGQVTVSFTGPDNAVLGFTVDGVTGSKTITRQRF